jgi:hypothetical protein
VRAPKDSMSAGISVGWACVEAMRPDVPRRAAGARGGQRGAAGWPVGIIAHTSRLYSNGQHAKLGFRCEASSFRGRPAIVPSSAGARSSQSGLAAWPEGLRSPPAELHPHSSRSPAVPERALRPLRRLHWPGRRRGFWCNTLLGRIEEEVR